MHVMHSQPDESPPVLQLSALRNIHADESISTPPRRQNTPIYKKTSFWGIVITSHVAIALFLVQWAYQRWTAEKDFYEYCQHLEVKPHAGLDFCHLTTNIITPHLTQLNYH